MAFKKEYDEDKVLLFKDIEHPSMQSLFYNSVWYSARNSTIVAKDGRSWVDFTAGIAVANSGHSNPAIIRALRKSLRNH